MTRFVITPALLALLLSGQALAQSTAFTYQGQLKDAGVNASGPHDFRFRLFDAASGGTQIGAQMCVDNLQVVDGIFTKALDFGAQFATAAARFLEIDVRRDTGLDCSNTGGFVSLASRQPITAAPLATHSFTSSHATTASRAFALSSPDGLPADAVVVDNVGNVGVGTTAPTARLDVRGGAMQVENLGDQADLLWLASERSWVFRQQGVGAGAALKLQSIGGGGNKNFVVHTDGLVGIGVTEPVAKLDVGGDARIIGPLSIANSQINLLSPVNRTYTVHHYDLIETDLGTGGTYSRTDSGLNVFGNQNSFACSVHLPDGATVVAVEAAGHDGSTSNDVIVTLGRTSFGGVSTQMANVNSSAGGGIWLTTSIGSPTVNNNTHAYWLRVGLGGGIAPFDCTIFAVRILYRISTPLP